MQEQKSREHLILEVLSFYDEMNFAQIVFELNDKEIAGRTDLTSESLLEVLRDLEKRKMIAKTKKNGDAYWTRIKPPRKNFLQRLMKKLFNY